MASAHSGITGSFTQLPTAELLREASSHPAVFTASLTCFTRALGRTIIHPATSVILDDSSRGLEWFLSNASPAVGRAAASPSAFFCSPASAGGVRDTTTSDAIAVASIAASRLSTAFCLNKSTAARWSRVTTQTAGGTAGFPSVVSPRLAGDARRCKPSTPGIIALPLDFTGFISSRATRCTRSRNFLWRPEFNSNFLLAEAVRYLR
mmetsp:Transcript_7139/g.20157  ORF Transcript_7139/g.20157 Transcript_7139/m.20157 type:complete len:207 (-) Transcript_7139:1518-2138(-)